MCHLVGDACQDLVFVEDQAKEGGVGCSRSRQLLVALPIGGVDLGLHPVVERERNEACRESSRNLLPIPRTEFCVFASQMAWLGLFLTTHFSYLL